MIDTEALRKKVLSLAFEGKLTEQLLSDSDVSTIVEKCRRDKEESINEGKYKKESFRGMVENTSKSIPTNWRWMFISDMSLFQEGPGILAVDFRKIGVPLIRISGMDGQSVSLKGCNYLDPEMVEEKWSHFKLDEGDILISTSASLDRISEVDEEAKGAIPYTGLIRFKMYGGIDKEYFKWFVKSPLYMEQVNNQKQGGFISHYGPTHLRKMMIPIAPIEEQQRIVETLDGIITQIQLIDGLKTKYSNDLTVLKSKIIDAGIRGKLTEQLPEDGDAEDLYNQIQEEKAKLIKEGKIKKEKPLPEITEGEIPFEIPKNWKWVYIGEVFEHNTGKALNSSDNEGIEMEYITTSNMYWDHFELDSLKKMCFKETEIEKCTIKKGDLLICEGGDIGRSAIWDLDFEMRIQNHIHKLRGHCGINHKYYYYMMRDYKDRGLIDGRGIGLQGFSSKRVHSLIAPLPPLSEQNRIVDVIDEMLRIVE